MLRVGLTGGIGSGKSTVARRLAEHGAIVVDADVVAREVVEPGTPGLAAIVDAFGADVLLADGRLDRERLGSMVFGDSAARARLNAIVHPLVARRTAELMAAAPPGAVVVNDVPLLAENGLAPGYHLVVVVEAPARQRVDRLAARGLTAADARARIAAQASDEERRDIADALIVNDRSVDELQVLVDRLWQERIEPYAANLRDRRRARDPETVVVPYDPTWPRQYERLAARVRHAVGDHRIDHVGSTAVPGLAAKNVIDLQLTVDSIDDADRLRGALESAAFVAVPAIDRDRPKPSHPDPEHWRKRYYGSADPGRRAHLHVRVAGSPGWRFALLFRDWLRANPDEAAAYQAEKYRLAARYPTQVDYAEAKEPWFDTAWARAERWAERVGWRPPT